VQRALAASIRAPKVALKGSLVRSAPDSPYAVEVLVKVPGGQYRPRTPKEADGLAFVPIELGETYAVRLVNQADHEAAVELSIDGLSTFAFSEVRQARRWIVPARGQILVRGWHISPKEINEFLITEYAKTAVAELGGSPEKIGTVTAVFRACWDRSAPPPAGEPTEKPMPSGPPVPQSSVGPGTGRGEKVVQDSQLVTDRVDGVVRSVVSVRYAK
jgi:hypothetical protein